MPKATALHKIAFFLVLEIAALMGVPMRPEEIRRPPVTIEQAEQEKRKRNRGWTDDLEP